MVPVIPSAQNEIQKTRIQIQNKQPILKGNYVLYWMQQSQRVDQNHALEVAISEGNRLRLPVLVFFGLTPDFPGANARHYTFMLEGLLEVKKELHQRGIKLLIQSISPDRGAIKLSRNAALLVTDRGYLRIQKQWRQKVAENIPCLMIQVESDVIVPVETASDKADYSAATLRRKLRPLLQQYLQPLVPLTVNKSSLDLNIAGMDIPDIPAVLKELKIPASARPVSWLKGGARAAGKWLADFIKHKLAWYPENKNDPTSDCVSNLSPYLHFGQISPLEIALKVQDSDSPGRDSFMEELVIRRELSMNFVHYHPSYDGFGCLPDWAQKTLNQHARDKRHHQYKLNHLENAITHDPYWNAAQKQMVLSGKMHGYLRMYWGKKVIEWSASPEKAQKILIYLNDKYSLDGRDANGYAGIAWCLGKHDRPWKERPIFGLVRYMNDRGLERKFNMKEYLKKIDQLEKKGQV
jgi:deoxyribodipyrimidine photo-lyase